MPCRSAAVALATFLAIGPAFAAEPAVISRAPDDVARGQIRFRSFGAADGLRNLVVVSIVQDGAGLLWVATDDGAYRYDGQQLTHYTQRDGLPAMGVRVLGVAPDGTPCAGTRDGLACWNGTRFTTAGTEGLPPVWIQALASGPGALWAGTSAGLYVRRGAGPFVRVPGLSARETKAIWADTDGVVVGDGASLRLGSGDGQWQVLGAEAGLDRERIDAVVRDGDGALWIRSVHHLWILRPGAHQVEDWSAGLPSGSDLSGVTCGMAVAPWGDVLVGSDRGVAYRRGDHWQLIDGAVGLPAREARALFVDREGTIWIGSLGLSQWMGRGLISRHDAASGMPGDVVWSMARDREHRLWAGTGQCLARLVDDAWACLPGTQLGSVRSFVFAPGGGMFFGGAPPDLAYVDAAGTVTTLALPGERIADRHLLALALAASGDLWIATTHGLFRLPGAAPGNAIERVTVPGERPAARFISLLAAGDEVWAAGDEGLAVLDGGSWYRFDRRAGLRGTAMRYVIRRSDGRTCVTFTDIDGLTCFRYGRGELRDRRDLSVPDGLTSGRVYFIGEDRAGRLWVGTGDGVDVVTPSGIDHFDETDGLVGNDSAARSFFEDDDGSVWLGASNGVSHFRAQHYRGPPEAPRAVLLRGTLGGRALASTAAVSRAPHDLSALNVSFAADGFLDPRRIEFQVRLSPLEAEWSTTRLREARYPALPPGSYRLELRARIGAGTWGPATVLAIEILPAWWQTRWFIALVGGLVLAVLAVLATWRQRVVWRRRARQLHQQSDAGFRALIESMPDLVAVYRDRRLFYLNQAARELLGFVDDSWRGAELLDRLHPDDGELARSLFNGPAGAVEMRLRGGDGSWRSCELSSRRIDLGDGPVTVVSGRDVTERHRLRAKLVLSDRLVSLGTLAAGIAHEINNPLAYVTANLEVVAESLDGETAGGPEHAERRAAIADAREGAERVRKIVRGLRSFSRYEEEKRVALALPDVIDAAIRLTGNELRHRAVVVRDLGVTPLVLADDGRLTQVLINLLVNAAHAIPEGNTDANQIAVRTRTDDQGRAVIEIEDSGTGMPPEVQARAFDPFFTTKAVGEGTGLGLSICHGIVTGLGGTITIESARVRGSIVRVVLPAVAGEVAAAEPARPAVPPAAVRRPHVLIVDDDPRVANAIKRMLSSDHELTVVACGAEALDQVASGVRFEAIVTDVMMPNMTGVELYDRLAAQAPDQAGRVIFLSGGVFTPQTQARLAASGNPSLQKPVSAQELRECVAGIVRAGRGDRTQAA